MACAARGYRLTIIMPASMTEERKTSIAAYGARLLLVPSLEQGRDMAATMARSGEGVLLVSHDVTLSDSGQPGSNKHQSLQNCSSKLSLIMSYVGATACSLQHALLTGLQPH